MAALVLFISLLLGMTGYSSAIYCVCKDGVGDSILQKNIDYACGNGADCTAILSTGGCYQPNTVKSHCDYAVNNYYQKKLQVAMSCDFSGTATVTNSLPTTVATGCTYASSSSQVTGSSTTSTSTTTGTGTGTGTPTTTTTSTPITSTGTSTGTGSSSSFNGMGPTGIDSTFGNFGCQLGNPLALAATAILSGLLVLLWG